MKKTQARKTEPTSTPPQDTLPPSLQPKPLPDFDSVNIEREAAACLLKVEERLDRSWASGTQSLDARGRACHYAEPHCNAWDIYGAVMLSTRPLHFDIKTKEAIEGLMFRTIKAAMPGDYAQRGVVTFNNSCTDVEQVLAVIRKAIKTLAPEIQERNARL